MMKKNKNALMRVSPKKNHNPMDPAGRWQEKWKSPAIGRILPNMITLAALCMGLTAVQFGLLKEWRQAVASVLIAGVLDGIDGRVARFLKSSSAFGAELDSLVDFINFGVAPALIVYCYTLSSWGNRGWGLCLFFSACMAWRLARFNTLSHHSSIFSLGIPAPLGALLAMTPMIANFVFDNALPVWVHGITLVITAIFLVSRYPTFVFKKITIPQNFFGIFCMSILGCIAGIFSAPWETLLVLSFIYILFLPISGYWFYKKGVS